MQNIIFIIFHNLCLEIWGSIKHIEHFKPYDIFPPKDLKFILMRISPSIFISISWSISSPVKKPTIQITSPSSQLFCSSVMLLELPITQHLKQLKGLLLVKKQWQNSLHIIRSPFNSALHPPISHLDGLISKFIRIKSPFLNKRH